VLILRIKAQVRSKHKTKVKNFFALKIAFLVPFYDSVFKLTDAIQITKDFLRAMPEKQTFNQILVVGKGRDIRCFSNGDWFPL
jgi:hypothetical protein